MIRDDWDDLDDLDDKDDWVDQDDWGDWDDWGNYELTRMGLGGGWRTCRKTYKITGRVQNFKG